MEIDTARPIFQIRAIPDKAATEKEGRPIFRDQEYVEIIVPGLKDRVCRKVSEADQLRWPDHYKRFKEKSDNSFVSGTPIAEWSYLTPSQIAACKALNILSVESIASLPDDPLRKLGPGCYEIQNQAKKFLSNETDSGLQIKELTKKLDAALARIGELEKPSEATVTRNKDGTPRKARGPNK